MADVSPELASYLSALLAIFLLGAIISAIPLEKSFRKALRFSQEKQSSTKQQILERLNAPSSLSLSWWTSEKQQQLERRSIFSTQWLYITHASRFQKAGDYRTFEISGLPILLILGKDKQIRAFHNVCRHRAYTVTKKECGSSLVLGCRYHGWSYDTKGKLIKAPEFDKVAGFDKSANGLWEVKSATRDGMVFVNFDNRDVVVSLPKTKAWCSPRMSIVKEWKVEGTFNWKLAVAPPEDQVKKEQSLWKLLVSGFLDAGTESILSPNCIVRKLNSTTVLTMRFLPETFKSTIVECCIYSREPDGVRDDLIEEATTTIQKEVEDLEVQQRRLCLGEIPCLSATVANLERLMATHRLAEEVAGYEINPAARPQKLSVMGIGDEEFCRNLEEKPSICRANADGVLDW